MARPLDVNKPLRQERIIAMLLRGAPKPEIQREEGCSAGTVERAEALARAVLDALALGRSPAVVAAELRCTPDAVDMLRSLSPAEVQRLRAPNRQPNGNRALVDANHLRTGQVIQWLYELVTTQSDFATMVRISDARLRGIVEGTVSPTLAELDRIATPLGLRRIAEDISVRMKAELAHHLKVPVERLPDVVSRSLLERCDITSTDVLLRHIREPGGSLSIDIKRKVVDHLQEEKEKLRAKRGE